jgi:hypothetical protein
MTPINSSQARRGRGGALGARSNALAIGDPAPTRAIVGGVDFGEVTPAVD